MNIDTKISILVCTNDRERCDKTLELALSRAKNKERIETLVFEDNNGKGISFAYNNLLTKAKGTILVFMHHDVDLFHEWDEKLIERIEPFDIIGAAGTSRFNIRQGRWWTVNPNTGEFAHAHGIVHHEANGNTWKTYFGPTPSSAQALDGFFIAAKRGCFDGELRWDEDYKYDFYDISFCVRAQQLGFNLGIIYLPLVHHSPGLRALDEDYEKIMKEFIEKYG